MSTAGVPLCCALTGQPHELGCPERGKGTADAVVGPWTLAPHLPGEAEIYFGPDTRGHDILAENLFGIDFRDSPGSVSFMDSEMEEVFRVPAADHVGGREQGTGRGGAAVPRGFYEERSSLRGRSREGVLRLKRADVARGALGAADTTLVGFRGMIVVTSERP